jgi:hypothetical protein
MLTGVARRNCAAMSNQWKSGRFRHHQEHPVTGAQACRPEPGAAAVAAFIATSSTGPHVPVGSGVALHRVQRRERVRRVEQRHEPLRRGGAPTRVDLFDAWRAHPIVARGTGDSIKKRAPGSSGRGVAPVRFEIGEAPDHAATTFVHVVHA